MGEVPGDLTPLRLLSHRRAKPPSGVRTEFIGKPVQKSPRHDATHRYQPQVQHDPPIAPDTKRSPFTAPDRPATLPTQLLAPHAMPESSQSTQDALAPHATSPTHLGPAHLGLHSRLCSRSLSQRQQTQR
ncbi:hypothetical protein AAFF_G00163060 [Aldrovandia affinis]|uniref:Uncharacterized protein n=1 Tax=Aldrovandia affinis TaxID=143900 RepID=A0AAD7SZY0_9TELE|nr:hypothetical protein AAFF_G00163060 [Aldrovandia affinis]